VLGENSLIRSVSLRITASSTVRGDGEDVAGDALPQRHRRAPHDVLRPMNRLSVPGRRGQHAEELRPIFASSTGKSDRETARILTERKVATATGAPWSPVTVARVRQRLQA
jgi:hypothetical protein